VGTCAVNGGAACFEPPIAVMVARGAGGAEVAPDFGCAPPSANASTIDVTMSGTITDYETGDPIPGAEAEIFGDATFTTALVTGTAAADGSYSVVIPAGTPDLVHTRGTYPAGYLQAYAFNAKLDLTQPTLEVDGWGMRGAWVATVAGLAGITQEPGTPTIIASALDCAGRTVAHAIITVSAAAGGPTHIAGANVVYTAPGNLPLPVSRDTSTESSNNGTAVITNLSRARTSVWVQAWGFRDAAALAAGKSGLTLVAQYEIPVFADSLVVIDLWPTEGP
jgi:hypothetical protein